MKGRKAELKVIEGGMTDDLPPMPAHLPDEMAEEWDRIVSDLNERQILAVSMLGTIETYVQALWTARQAQKAIAEHGVLTVGAEGAMKNNPASNLLWRTQAIISRLAAELGLTPAARSKAAFQPKEEDIDDLFSGLDL